MKIFITGASGFIGGEAANYLKQFHDIFAMARSDEAAKKIAAIGVKPVICNLENISSIELNGIDTIIHSAAFVKEWGSKEDFFQANVIGTQRLLEQAKLAKVKRFIFISTEAVLFKGQDLLNINESYPLALDSPYLYSKTKAQAEQAVLNANSENFCTLALRPCFVWGPNDRTILPLVLKMIHQNKFMWIDHGNQLTMTTHIQNLVHAIYLSLTHGRCGEAYFINDGVPITMKNFLTQYVETQNVIVPQKSISRKKARSIAWLTENIWRLFGLKSRPPMVRFSIDLLSSARTIDITKAKKDLGYQPLIDIDEGLKAMQQK